MAHNVIELSTLMLNSSNWEHVNVLNNVTPGIPPSKVLRYSISNSSSDNTSYIYLSFNLDIAPAIGGNNAGFNSLNWFFGPDIFIYGIACTYPASGQYGFLNRLLDYILMIFALIAGRRTWLAAATLGTEMTVAASAAMHTFALLT